MVKLQILSVFLLIAYAFAAEEAAEEPKPEVAPEVALEQPPVAPEVPEQPQPQEPTEAEKLSNQFYTQLDGAKKTLQQLQQQAQQKASEIMAKVPSVEEIKQNLPQYQAQAKKLYDEYVSLAKTGAISLYERVPVEVKDKVKGSGKKVVNVFKQVVGEENINKAIAQGNELYAKLPEIESAVQGKLSAARQYATSKYAQHSPKAAELSAAAKRYFETAKVLAFEEAHMSIDEVKVIAQQLKKKAETVYVALNQENFEKLKAQGLLQAKYVYTRAKAAATTAATEFSHNENVQFVFSKIPMDQVKQVFSEDNVAYVKVHISQAETLVKEHLDRYTPVFVRTLSAAKEQAGNAFNVAKGKAVEVYEQLHLDAAKPYVDMVRSALDQAGKAAKPHIEELAKAAKPYYDTYGRPVVQKLSPVAASGAAAIFAGFNNAKNAVVGYLNELKKVPPSDFSAAQAMEMDH